MAKPTTTKQQSIKHPGGRPLAFKSAEELQEKIDEYFQYCDDRAKKTVDSDGKEIMVSYPEPYTMSGLAVYLGVDRTTILNYGERDEFFSTIKQARARVEADVERRMVDKSTFTPGLIFNAKNNFGWRDDPTTLVQVNTMSMNVLDESENALNT